MRCILGRDESVERSMTMNPKIRMALQEAVTQALKEIGLEQFKKTSFFMSSTRASEEVKLAA